MEAETPFMSVWVIYYDPTDFPGKYVLRRHDVFRGSLEPRPSAEYSLAESLDGIRDQLPPGLIYLPRFENDDAKIVETWI